MKKNSYKKVALVRNHWVSLLNEKDGRLFGRGSMKFRWKINMASKLSEVWLGGACSLVDKYVKIMLVHTDWRKVVSILMCLLLSFGV